MRLGEQPWLASLGLVHPPRWWLGRDTDAMPTCLLPRGCQPTFGPRLDRCLRPLEAADGQGNPVQGGGKNGGEPTP